MDTSQEQVSSFYARLVQLPSGLPAWSQQASAAGTGAASDGIVGSVQEPVHQQPSMSHLPPAATVKYVGFRSSGVHDMSNYRPGSQTRPSGSATGEGPGPPLGPVRSNPIVLPPASGGSARLAAAEALLEAQWQAAHGAHAAQGAHGRGLPRLEADNVGYRLLKAAGWREGRGLGSEEQGRVVPINAVRNPGAQGIGFVKQAGPVVVHQEQGRAQVGPGGLVAGRAAVTGAGGEGAAEERAAKKARIAQIVEQELAGETLETKVALHRAAARADMEAARGRAIQRALYRAFDDPFDNVGAATANSNPLAGRNRLTATNPLLDDDDDS